MFEIYIAKAVKSTSINIFACQELDTLVIIFRFFLRLINKQGRYLKRVAQKHTPLDVCAGDAMLSCMRWYKQRKTSGGKNHFKGGEVR
jgi:hypothetical protein